MRIIDKAHKKIKGLIEHSWFDEIMLVFIVMFVGLGSFSLGVIYEQKSYLKENPVSLTYSEEAIRLWEEYQSLKLENQEFFASKNGSVVYPVGCSKGGRIKEENRIFFQNLEQAQEQGYREVSGC